MSKIDDVCPTCEAKLEILKSGVNGQYIFERFCTECTFCDFVPGDETLGSLMSQAKALDAQNEASKRNT